MTLSDLIPRIESGEGEDRELEAEIWLATTPGATRRKSTVTSSKGLWPPYVLDETRDATAALITVPAYTTSVDAVLALVEAKGLNAMKLMDDALAAMMLCGWDTDKPIVHALARALLAAVCRAKEDKDG